MLKNISTYEKVLLAHGLATTVQSAQHNAGTLGRGTCQGGFEACNDLMIALLEEILGEVDQLAEQRPVAATAVSGAPPSA